MKAIIILFILITLIYCGLVSISEGDVDSAMTFLWLPVGLFFGAILSLSFKVFYEKPREKRQEALHKKYFIPQDVRNDDEGRWERKFQNIIARAIEATSDTTKISDLRHCQSVIKEMNKGRGYYSSTHYSYFSKINEAFRLTDCHLTITDSEGNTIAKIV